MPKGIKLTGDNQQRLDQINNYIGELGGKKIRRRRNNFSGKLEYSFNGKRSGECDSTSSKKPESWNEQPCFGHNRVTVERPWGEDEIEQSRIFMKAKGQYDNVEHYTLVDCVESCWHEAIVVCVRELIVSQETYMTAHVAGKCPYCKYHTTY